MLDAFNRISMHSYVVHDTMLAESVLVRTSLGFFFGERGGNGSIVKFLGEQRSRPTILRNPLKIHTGNHRWSPGFKP